MTCLFDYIGSLTTLWAKGSAKKWSASHVRDEPRNWKNVEDILIQWVDIQRINRGIQVSIDVLYARTKHGGPPPHEGTIKEDVPVSPVKKKTVSPCIDITVQALTVLENNQFSYLSKHNSCHCRTGHPEGTRRRICG